MSAMRMFAAAAFVSVDERAVFGRCLPRWEIACDNFYETASYVVRGRAPVVGAGAVVRNAELHPGLSWVRTNHGCIWGCPQCGVGPGPRFS